MASSTLRKAFDTVKDQTRIGIAIISNGARISDLEVAIVKATMHEERPANEKHIVYILSLTCYSKSYIKFCVKTIAKRLNKTSNWVVALKSLMLVHRLLLDGDANYEQEIFHATRRGTRMLNMADFRNTFRSASWDFSTFVRAYALYLDERLDFRMQMQQRIRGGSGKPVEHGKWDGSFRHANSTPVRDMRTERIFLRAQHLLNLLERCLACRPAGETRYSRIVLVALYPVVKESFQIYYDITELMGILVDRFMELQIPQCVKVHEIFTRIGTQFILLENFYNWCKAVGVARSSDYPEVEKITPEKLEAMADLIHDKSILERSRRANNQSLKKSDCVEEEKEMDTVVEDDLNAIKALPPPEGFIDMVEDKKENKKEVLQDNQQADLLDLSDDITTHEQPGDRMALALFDGESAIAPTASTVSAWEAFGSPDDSTDWETTLVQSASHLSNQKVTLGGGFDMSLLDNMYKQPTISTTLMHQNGVSGSASSMALGSSGWPIMLALPGPPVPGSTIAGGDPFQASLSMPPPAYVQMSEMEKKQKLLVEEQLIWQQYANNGRQVHLGFMQRQPHTYSMGTYAYGY
ncbi:hypothetical protein Syun_003510 [Stephania yunnanensis]|uniref:ENTH domain-containing protein n=1 Tax=Stephania yunnanensis TaxID=152371 RepID=A0AAP0Q0A3_9MAGN